MCAQPWRDQQQDSSCFRCGRRSHDLSQCPAKEVVCYNCGVKGHFKRYCKKEHQVAAVSALGPFEPRSQHNEYAFEDDFMIEAVTADSVCEAEMVAPDFIETADVYSLGSEPVR